MNVSIGGKWIKRLMNELDIHSLMARRFKKPGTHVEYSQRPNLVKDFNESHSIWYVDITYIELNPGKLVYLSMVLEEHSSKMLAYKISISMTSDLVTETMLIALKHHPKTDIYILIWAVNIPVNRLKSFFRFIKLNIHTH